MENEMFTFVICSHLGHSVEYQYCNRREADALFNRIVGDMSAAVTGLFVAYYCASAGGLVNAHYAH